MFDQVVVRPRRGALKPVLVVGSAVAHGAVVAILTVAAMWQVDKVSLGPERGEVTFQAPRPPAGAAALPSGRLEPVKLRPVKVKVTTVVQPPAVPDEPTPPAPGGGPDGDPTAGAGGGGDGPPDALPCPQEPCATDGEPTPPDPPVPPRIPPPPANVPLPVARGLRIAGDEQLYPSRTTQLAIVHDGKAEVRGTFKLCIDEHGAVASVRRMASTGYQEYDEVLIAGMRGWRYRPYQVGGRRTPMCTVQLFVYRIRD